jgi:hypothetical protein
LGFSSSGQFNEIAVRVYEPGKSGIYQFNVNDFWTSVPPSA